MPDRPHLFFPASQVTQRNRPRRRIEEHLHVPPPERQRERLAPKFEDLGRASLQLQATADGMAPEDVLVFEVAGNLTDFAGAARSVGLELLSTVDAEFDPDEDFHLLVGGREGEMRGDLVVARAYLTASSQQALTQILSLWNRWRSERPLEHGFTSWRAVFEHLKDVRRWGVKDRLYETGIIEDWNYRLFDGQDALPVEIELFFAPSESQREQRSQHVRALISEGGGAVITESEIPEIRYHAILASIPAFQARAVLDQVREGNSEGFKNAFVQEVTVQFLRPAGQLAVPLSAIESTILDEAGTGAPPANDQPIVALLDGMPLQNHKRLEGRLIVHDPDGVEEKYEAYERMHGTWMASLIVWGDLGHEEEPARRPLFVRPIMRPHHDGNPSAERREQVIGLSVDTIHRAVREMFEGAGANGPVAPTIRVINLSIGEQDRPFLGSMSPLARLLDWLAVHYGVLFVVSAGNLGDHPELDPTSTGYSRYGSPVDPQRLEKALVTEGVLRKRHRSLYAPAEALNVITVGAHDHDYSDGSCPRDHVLSLSTPEMPAIYSRVGPGCGRSVKPDVLQAGGRVALRLPMTSADRKWRIYGGRLFPPGHRVASPGPRGSGAIDRVEYTCGTSNAAALTSRAAEQLYDLLVHMQASDTAGILRHANDGLWLKALLTHSAHWPKEASERVREILREADLRATRKDLARVFGYGVLRPEWMLASNDHRVTLLASGLITHDAVNSWSLPLPFSLAGRSGYRRLAITLAWFVPPPISQREHRSAKLFFRPKGYEWVASSRQADYNDVQRGTVQHEIFEGERATAFAQADSLEIEVFCDDRERLLRGGGQTLQVSYALIATLEVAPSLGLSIYDEVRAAVQQATRVRV